MESVGEKLKKLRLQKGISLEEVHKKTKINLDILRAIEENNIINLSPVYMKGFLKIYCKFLGVNPDDYIVDVKEKRTIVQAPEKKGKGPTFLKSVILKMPPLDPKIILRAAVVLAAIIILVGLFKIGKAISSKMARHKNKVVTVSKASPKLVAKSSKTKQTPAIKPVPAETTPNPKEKIQSKVTLPQVTLGLLAKEDCWVTIKADGQIIFQGMIKKGRYESWQAKDKIEFSLNNAAAAQLEVNNKVIPALGRKGQALKNIVVSRDGKISTNQ